MTNLHTSEAVTGTGDRSRPRAALPALCATQITSWGIVYYAFPVLNPQITAATGWSATATTGAFSGALLVSALTGIPVGRILDRRGPRAVMTTGSLLGVVAVVAIAYAPNLAVFTAAWLLAGVAMAATFYQPAFAALTRWWGADRVRALTVVTLAGGLASTAFAPLTAALAEHLSWRTTYAVLAVILALVTIPAHAFALRAPWPPAPTSPSQRDTPNSSVIRSCPFLMLATALTLNSFAMYAVVIALVPLLIERGASPTAAAWALGLGGAGQTLGRTLYATLARRTGVTTRTVALIVLGGITTAAFAMVSGPFPSSWASRSWPAWCAATSPCSRPRPSPTGGARRTTGACPGCWPPRPPSLLPWHRSREPHWPDRSAAIPACSSPSRWPPPPRPSSRREAHRAVLNTTPTARLRARNEQWAAPFPVQPTHFNGD